MGVDSQQLPAQLETTIYFSSENNIQNGEVRLFLLHSLQCISPRSKRHHGEPLGCHCAGVVSALIRIIFDNGDKVAHRESGLIFNDPLPLMITGSISVS